MAQRATLFQLGMDLGYAPRKAHAEVTGTGPVVLTPVGTASVDQDPSAEAEPKDHFIIRDGKCYAGSHLIIDLWGASRLDDLEHIRSTLIEAVKKAGATLLHIHLHHFTPNGGVSGVAVLAESHISIHTWPERNYAALDVFMCGDAVPMATIPVLEEAFSPGNTVVDEVMRGEVQDDESADEAPVRETGLKVIQ